MKKFITVACAVFFILPTQIFAASVTIEQLQEQIKVLQAQIAQMTGELSATKKEVASIKEELRITKTLKLGMTDEEVNKLQGFLSTMPDVYPEGMVTGYFGHLTERAVKKWQEQNGIESIGIVGPKTRAKIGEISGKIPFFGVSDTIASPRNSTEGLISTTTPRGLENRAENRPITTPSGTTPATPAEPATPSPGTGTSAIPAVPATPAQPSPPTPQDTTPPTISNVQAINIAETSATITWTTNELASSEVYYALNSPVTATSTIKATGTNNVTSHSVSLIGLSSGKTHYYVAVSKDAAGNTATSSEQSFTTLTPPPAQLSTIVVDDFNTYSNGSIVGQGGWSSYVNGENYMVQGTTTFEGVKALYNNGQMDSVVTKAGTSLPDGRQSVYVKTDNRAAWGNYADGNAQVRVSKGGWGGSESRNFIAVSFKRDSNAAYYDPVGDTYKNFAVYNDNEWILLEFEWRSSDKKARYRVNSGTWTDWYQFAGGGTFTNFDNVGFDFFSPSGSGGVYFDNLR